LSFLNGKIGKAFDRTKQGATFIGKTLSKINVKFLSDFASSFANILNILEKGIKLNLQILEKLAIKYREKDMERIHKLYKDMEKKIDDYLDKVDKYRIYSKEFEEFVETTAKLCKEYNENLDEKIKLMKAKERYCNLVIELNNSVKKAKV
jgi:hypothetical protein